MSREIFLVNDYDGGFRRIAVQRFHRSPIRIPLLLRDIIPAGPQAEGALVCSKGTNLGPAQQSSAGLLPLGKGD